MKIKVPPTLLQLLNSQGLSQSSVNIVGNGLGTGLSALALILISRQLGPEKFGEFSIGFALILILTKINEFGMNNVILKFANIDLSHDRNNAVFGFVLKFRLIFTALIMISGLILAPLLAKWLKFDDVSIIFVSFTLGLATTYYEYIITLLQSLHRFFQTVSANFLQAGLKLAMVIVLLLLQVGNSSVYFSLYVLIPLIPVILANWFLPKWVRVFTFAGESLPQKAMWQLAQHSAVAQISIGIIDNIDILFVQYFLNTYETGLYGGITRIGLLFAMVAYSLGGVLNARVSRYKTHEHLRPYIKKAFLVVGAAAIGFILFIPFAGLLIRLTIGEQYLSGLPELLILAAAAFLGIACVPFSALFFSFKEDWYFSVSGVMQVIIMIVGNVLFVPMFGLPAAAMTKLVTKLALFGFTVVVAMVLYRRRYANNRVIDTPKTPVTIELS